jgi:hypothetical protein
MRLGVMEWVMVNVILRRCLTVSIDFMYNKFEIKINS